MERKLINLEAFVAKLADYRNSLEEMNQLTDEEVQRISSIGIDFNEDGIEKETALFIHMQMDRFLNKLRLILNEMPYYSVSKEVFLCDEIKALQKQVLVRLKELRKPGQNIEL